jgi:hypothetical protein
MSIPSKQEQKHIPDKIACNTHAQKVHYKYLWYDLVLAGCRDVYTTTVQETAASI